MDKRYHYKGNKSLYGLLIASKPYNLCTFRKIFGCNFLSIQLYLFINNGIQWYFHFQFSFDYQVNLQNGF